MRSSALSFLAAALQLGHVAQAVITDTPTVENFVRRFSATAIVIGNYVYIDGGEISQLDNGRVNPARTTNQVNSTLSLDLSKSWTTTDVVFKTTAKAPGPVKANVVLWADRARNAFYSWGGKWVYGENMNKTELWKFNADGSGGGRWRLEPPANPSLFNGLIPAEFIAFTTVNNTGYAIGGQASGWTELYRGSNQAISGMLTYNFDTREWTNETDPTGFTPFHSIAQASAHYVPTFGPGGLVFVLGGHHPDTDREPSISNSPAQNFENLTFFDPGAKKTYSQKATGDIPPSPRSEFCTAGWQNPDGGYEIFLFGGDNKIATGKPKYRDAYILSLPGFVWTKLPEPPAGARAYHSCVSVGGRQILSIGGTMIGSTERDDAPQGLLLFDMTAMKWKDSYDATAAPYERPEAIKKWYTDGGLEKVGWNSDVVRGLFVKQNAGEGGGNENTPAVPDAPKSNVAAIAGGVAGGVVFLVIVAAVTWCMTRRKRKGGPAAELGNDTAYQSVPPTSPSGQQYLRPVEASGTSPYSELAVPVSGRPSPLPEKHGYATELPHKEASHAELPSNGGVLSVVPDPNSRAFVAELDGGNGTAQRYS